MANFDIAELALKSICPSNTILYDDKEMPSIMVYIPKFRLCDVLSTTDTSIHPAFRKGGLEAGGFYIGKFRATTTAGGPTACPVRTPATMLPWTWWWATTGQRAASSAK